MEVELNWVAIALAVVASFVVGAIWYAPPVFGNMWMKLINMKPETMKKGPGASAWLRTVIGALLQAFILAHITYLSYAFYDTSWMSTSLTTGFWLWLGLQLSMVLTHDAFEQRPFKLTLLTAGNQFVTLMSMAIIIGLFQP